MISKCTNPQCRRPFKYLRDGKVFVIQQRSESPGGQADLIGRAYFLCAECSRTHTIIARDGQPVVIATAGEKKTELRIETGGAAA
jgi:hypothetical protein